MENNKVLTELKDGVLIITINRPERRNAIDPETANLMESILNDAEKDPAVGAILITGSGEKSFCAGEDLKALAENDGVCMTETENALLGTLQNLHGDLIAGQAKLRKTGSNCVLFRSGADFYKFCHNLTITS